MLDSNLDVGAALRAARQGLGLSLDDIADATRVKSRHLAALEARETDQLPSRPFTIGYVRAYARALGLDADQVAQRYRAENPSPDDEELHSPVGVASDTPARNSSLMLLAALLVVAVVGWNIARHSIADSPKRPARASPHALVAQPQAGGAGVFAVDTPLPAPPEASLPAPYHTPGLDAAAAAGGSADAADAAAKAAAAQGATSAGAAARTPFVAAGAVYGPASGASSLIIQARKPISLEIRGAGGVVYFARELAAGEAYRVPNLPGLTAEVSNPESAELFEGGVSKGVFPTAQLPLKTAG